MPSSRPATAMAVVFETGSMSNFLLGGSVPFTVEPSEGRLVPGDSVEISVKFSPFEISEFSGILKFT